MQLTVEFYCGLARRLSGQSSAVIEVSDHATLRDVCGALAEKIPAFLGPLVAPQAYDLVEPHFFSLNGRRATSLDETVQEGDRILLMVITAGG